MKKFGHLIFQILMTEYDLHQYDLIIQYSVQTILRARQLNFAADFWKFSDMFGLSFDLHGDETR